MKTSEGGAGGEGTSPLWAQTGITHRSSTTVPTDGRLVSNGLRPADILLFWSTPSSASSRFIAAFQAEIGIPAQACQIAHVALVENGESVIHATYSLTNRKRATVHRDSLHGVCGGSTISVVRALPVEAEAERQAVVEAAARLVGQPYSLRMIAWTALFPWLPERAQAHAITKLVAEMSTAQVCSTLVFGAFNSAMRDRSPLDPGASAWAAPIILPAYFFWNPKLIDVALPLEQRQPRA